MSVKKAVVTGGAGFIGSHLVEELVERGYRVTVLDDMSTGRMEHISGPLSNQGVDLVKGSVTDLPLMEKLLEGARYVFHLAAVVSVMRSIEEPLVTNRVNVVGTLNTLMAARKNAVSKVLLASSAAVYSDAEGQAVTEDGPVWPSSPYGASKLAGEAYCQAFFGAYGLAFACLRYFNVYGPRQSGDTDYAAVVPRFVGRALSGLAPVIFGDGEQTRDLIYVKDVARASVIAAESEFRGVLNVAGGAGISVNNLAGLIINITHASVEPVREPARAGEIKHSRADISRIRDLGFEPRFTLEAGLTETVSWAGRKNRGVR